MMTTATFPSAYANDFQQRIRSVVRIADNDSDVLVVADATTSTTTISGTATTVAVAVAGSFAATVSSSSESLFTDPLTPLGFAAELNQCYYSDDDLSGGCFTRTSATTSAAISPQRRQRTPKAATASTASVLARKLSRLSQTPVEVFDTAAAMMIGELESPMAMQLPNGGGVGGGATLEGRNASGVSTLFSVSRVKKVELPDLQAVKLSDDQFGELFTHLFESN